MTPQPCCNIRNATMDQREIRTHPLPFGATEQGDESQHEKADAGAGQQGKDNLDPTCTEH
jgi:hypothetical protein